MQLMHCLFADLSQAYKIPHIPRHNLNRFIVAFLFKTASLAIAAIRLLASLGDVLLAFSVFPKQ